MPRFKALAASSTAARTCPVGLRDGVDLDASTPVTQNEAQIGAEAHLNVAEFGEQ